MLGMFGERSMEAVSQDWRAWVVGIFSATVCRLSGFLQGLPLVLDIPWTFGASLISFSASPSHIRIMITCFNLGTLNIACAQHHAPLSRQVGSTYPQEISWAVRRLIIYY